jgi:hypothetical protein
MKRSSFLTLMCCVLQSKSWAITEKPATYAPPWSGALADLGIIATYSVKSKYNNPSQPAIRKSTSLKSELEEGERRRETRTGSCCVARLYAKKDAVSSTCCMR